MTPKKTHAPAHSAGEIEVSEEPTAEHEAVLVTKEVDASLPETPKAVKEVKLSTCGHINRHHFGPDGKPLELACDLDPKHTGDHHAKYQKNVAEQTMDEKGRVIKVTYHQEEADAYWGDAASKPVAEIVEGKQVQMNLLQKEMVMEILNRDPRMTAQEAINIAKAKPEWNAASL